MKAKPDILLPTGETLPVLYEDRSVLAIDKPPGWMLVPFSWQKTDRNLMAALISSMEAGDFWARSRGLRFLRNIHRLDAETSGVLLFAKNPGALQAYGRLFESRRMAKRYWAVVEGTMKEREWTCRLALAPDPATHGLMRVDSRNGKEAETVFRVRETRGIRSLIEAEPYTGRTHQIRVHLARSGYPILGDELYNPQARPGEPLALRAIELSFQDPFTRRQVRISAATDAFQSAFGFAPKATTDPGTSTKP